MSVLEPGRQDFVKGSLAPQDPYRVEGGLGFPAGAFLDPAMTQAQVVQAAVPNLKLVTAGIPLGDVAMTTANTYYAGPVVTVGPGTWLIFATALVKRAGGAAAFTAKVTAHLVIGTLGGAETYAPTANEPVALTCFAVYVNTADSNTVTLSVASTGASSTMLKSPPDNDTGNSGTAMFAIQVG